MLFLAARNSLLFAQPDSLWSRTYALGDRAVATSVVSTRGGGFALCGYTLDAVRGDSAVGWLLRLDAAGDSLWYRELPAFARIYQLSQFPAEHDFLLSGRSPAFSALVARCDAAGAIVWSHEVGTQAEFRAHCLTADSGVACCGYRWLDSGSRQDILVATFSNNGVPRWQWTSNLSGWDQAQAITALPGGDLIVSGYTVRIPNAAWIVRLSANGFSRAPVELLPTANTFIRGSFIIPAGMAEYTVATTQAAANRSASFSLTQMSATDEALWQVSESDPAARREIRSMLPLTNGDYFICGMISDSTRDMFLEQRHAAQPPRWAQRLPAATFDIAAADMVGAGEFVIAGTQSRQDRSAIFVMRLGTATISPVTQVTLNRTSPSTADMCLRWHTHPTALSYNIYRGTTAKLVAGHGTWIGSTTATTYVDRNILQQPGTSYFYIVTAVTASASTALTDPKQQATR